MTAPISHLRAISTSDWKKRGRWVWLEAVRHADLSTMARLLAHELVLEFADRNTGACFPSPQKCAANLRCSVDTIKRALRELAAAHFIARLAGSPGGRGHPAQILFLSQAEILPLNAGKRGAAVPPFIGERGAAVPPFDGSQRGAKLHAKGGQNCPLDPEKDPYTRACARGPSQNPVLHEAAERAVREFRAGVADAVAREPIWVQDHIAATGMMTAREWEAARFAKKGTSP